MDISNIITILLTAICSGGLSWIFTLKYTKRKAKYEADFSGIENFEKKVNAYNVMIEDLDSKVIKLVEKNNKIIEDFNKYKHAHQGVISQFEHMKINYDCENKCFNKKSKNDEPK